MCVYGEMVVYPPMPHESTSSVFVPDAGAAACAVGPTTPNPIRPRSLRSIRPTRGTLCPSGHGGPSSRWAALARYESHRGSGVPRDARMRARQEAFRLATRTNLVKKAPSIRNPRHAGDSCFQSLRSRCRLPRLPGGASSKSIGSLPPEVRAARDHTSPTRKSTRTRRYGKLRSGKTSAPGRHRLRRAASPVHPPVCR